MVLLYHYVFFLRAYRHNLAKLLQIEWLGLIMLVSSDEIAARRASFHGAGVDHTSLHFVALALRIEDIFLFQLRCL